MGGEDGERCVLSLKVERRLNSRKSTPSQIDKFKAAGRDLECDDSEAAFEDKLKKIATQPAKKTSQK